MKISSTSEIVQKIKNEKITEHLYENIELKRDWSREHGEKISMLCNGNTSGYNFLIIGLEDNGDLSGHDEKWLSKRLEQISQQLNSDLDPAIALEQIETHEINGNHIILISFQNPGVVVYWCGKAWTGKGTTKRKLDTAEILELSLKLPGLKDTTKFPCEFEANSALLSELCRTLEITEENNALEKYNLKNSCGKILIGSTKYRIVKYDLSNSVVKNEEREGLLGILSPKFYDEIRAYYSSHSNERLKITNELLREAIGNSVAHAAYHEGDGEIIIELFPQRIQITNLAYNEYTSLANKWFSSAHKSPNPFLMETLRLLNKTDELGRGKKKILSECLSNGFNTPFITITDAGRYKRWSLVIDFGRASEKQLRAFRTIRETYSQEKALIAYSLVLWSNKNFSEIKTCFDSFESRIAAEIISDPRGPIFYWRERDKLIPHRWMRILLEEGKSSKGFSPFEEEELYKTISEIQNEYEGGYLTPSAFRELAHLSNSQSDKTLTSKTLKNWEQRNLIRKVKRGLYKFTEHAAHSKEDSVLSEVLTAFSK